MSPSSSPVDPAETTQLLLPIRRGAAELARALGQPLPTAEQTAVIEAPTEPCAVVAGAGSGKTETMAARVVWLVANGLVRPEQILGLTFTRKAARELASRIRRRLGQLRRQGYLDEVGDVTVSTYDAYAQRIVAEHALRYGREPSPRLLTEAMAWQYADRVVRSYDGDMDHVERALTTVTRDVVDLHAELAGHLVTVPQLNEFTERLVADIEGKPAATGSRTAMYAEVRKLLERQRARAQLLPLVDRFAAEKRRREAVDFSDQAALAARLADGFAEVGQTERARFPVVLLDEYQDTSHAQLVMLRGLFGVPGHPVTAVGDPCQSIYGWRGASAQTLEAFGRHFRCSDGSSAPVLPLATSFRNGSRVLAVANAVSRPLRESGLSVPELSAGPATGEGEVVVELHETAEHEAQAIAERAAAEWNGVRSGAADRGHGRRPERSASRPGPTAEDRPSIAVLVRARAQIDRVVHALRSRDLPVEVVGVGGLLSTPAVADIVATLQVLADPTRGDALMRLLSGSRWRIGPVDLDALGRWARRLVQQSVSASARSGTAMKSSTQGDDEASIVDALDSVDSAPEEGFFSPVGRRRLSAFSEELRGLRRRSGQALVDLVGDVVRTLRLDVEVAARTGDPAVSRADLDAFLDVVVDFSQSGEEPTLTSFLAYLEAAADEERGLETTQPEVDRDRIQVLTVHGAKGLEWDVVFVPGMMDELFPSKPRAKGAWLSSVGVLPFELRGDAEALPHAPFEQAADQQELEQTRKQFLADCEAWALLEERRLAYVALTRARRLLVASGHWWGDGACPRKLGSFLSEIAEVCGTGVGSVPVWCERPKSDEDGTPPMNPLNADPPSRSWPYDPLDEQRRSEVQAGADLVREAGELIAAGQPLPDEVAEAAVEWQRDVDLLLAERARRARSDEVRVQLPDHLSVSQLVQLRRDPAALAASIRRPVPHPPNPLARRGTAFHAWLESRFGMPQLLDLDELPGAADDTAAPDDQLLALQQAFGESVWADRQPLEVEVPFELVIGGVVVRGRADAVFPTEGGIEVVDWKTGRPPSNPEEEAARSVQLAAYRLAWAEMTGRPLQRVGAAFHYVRYNLTARPVDLLDRAGLEELLASVGAEKEPDASDRE